MITAVDTNVLLDVFANDPIHAEASATLLRKCITQGQLIVCDIVWAELASAFPNMSAMNQAMKTLGVEFSPMQADSAVLAGRFWQKYRQRGGQERRVVADFLIGAHAVNQADRLATRDRGFYRDYFKNLTVAS